MSKLSCKNGQFALSHYIVVSVFTVLASVESIGLRNVPSSVDQLLYSVVSSTPHSLKFVGLVRPFYLKILIFCMPRVS